MQRGQLLEAGAAGAHAGQRGGGWPPPVLKPAVCGGDAHGFIGCGRHGDLQDAAIAITVSGGQKVFLCRTLGSGQDTQKPLSPQLVSPVPWP